MPRFVRVCLLIPLFVAAFSASGGNGPYQHVLLLSVDGLHNADINDPSVAPYIPDILDIAHHGITYSNAYAVKPTDNFPNMIAQVTGAGPKTSGIYYDETYRSDYFPAFSFPGSPPGTNVTWTGAIDIDPSRINGGGNSDSSSIDPNLLPQKMVNGVLQTVYPHDDLKVNTIFEVAHNAGLRTAYIDKHPSYDIVKGPSGQGLDDFYGPESDAKAKLVNNVLVDSSVTGTTKGLTQISKSIQLSEAYDDMRVDALINQINGKTSAGAPAPSAPALFGLSFIAVNTAQKDPATGGIDNFDGVNIVNSGLGEALQRTNASVHRVVDALKTSGLYDSTLIVLTAKHGQNPRVGAAIVEPTELVVGTLGPGGIGVLKTTDDDVSLVWLADHSQAQAAKDRLLQVQGDYIDQVLIGADLTAAGLGTPADDNRAPDLIVKYKPNVLIASSLKRAEHGGFSEDDSHIAMILGGGAIPEQFQGELIDNQVLDTQLAPTMLEALGLDPSLLQGVQIDGTQVLPGAPVPEPVALIPLLAFSLLARRGRASRAV
jgi:hypothetical protein